MAFDFLLKDDVVNSIVKDMEEAINKGSHKTTLEAMKLVQSTGIAFSDFLLNAKRNQLHNFFVGFFSNKQTQDMNEVLNGLIAEKNLDICSAILSHSIMGKINKTQDEIEELALWVVKNMEAQNIFTQDEKNAFSTSNNGVAKMLSQIGFYKFSPADFDKIEDVNNLYSKIDLVKDYLNKNKDLPNNIKILIPGLYKTFHLKLEDNELVDFLYSDLKKHVGSKSLFRHSYSDNFTIDINKDILNFVNDIDYVEIQKDKNYKVNIDTTSYLKGICGCNILSQQEKKNFSAGNITYFSHQAAIDYIDEVFHSNEITDDDKVKYLNDWLTHYNELVVKDSSFEYFKPLQKFADLSIECKIGIGLLEVSSLCNSLHQDILNNGFSYHKKEVEIVCELSRKILKNNIDYPTIYGDKKFLPTFDVSHEAVLFLANYAKDENAKNFVFDLLPDYLSKASTFSVNNTTKVDVLKFITKLENNWVSDFINTPILNNSSEFKLEDCINHTEEEIKREDFRGDLLQILWNVVTDNVEDRRQSNKNRIFTVEERKALVSLALSNDEILERMKTEKIGKSSFFKKMLSNSFYGDFIIESIAKNLENPIVKSFLEIKSFREAMSISNNELAQSTLLKMQIDKKLNALELPKEASEDNGVSFKL